MAKNIKSIKDTKRLSLRESLLALRALPRFFREVRSIDPLIFWTNVVGRIASAAIPIALLYVGKLVIDAIVAITATSQPHDLTQLWTLVAVELGLVVVSDLLNRYITYNDGIMGDLYSNKSSVYIILKSKDVEIAQLEDPQFYDKLERARTQTGGRVFLLSTVLAQVQSIITVGTLIVGLIAFAPMLILLLIVSIIPSFINEFKFSAIGYSVAKSWTQERRELDYLRYIGANDKTAKELKLFGLSDFIAQRFASLANQYFEVNKSLAQKRTIWGFFFNIIGVVSYYGAYVLIIYRTINGILTIGDLTFLSGSFNRLKNGMESIFSRFTRISENALYLQDYFDFLDINVEAEISKTTTILVPEVIKEGFVFDDVTFYYPDTDVPVIKNLSMTIHAGQKVAFVGENGAGKTTLIKLMLRFYKPTSGHIYLDGVPISSYDKESYQRLFGVIFQDFVRYELDVRENIAVGKIEDIADEERILQAASLSLADEVIESLPEGLDQQLGKRFKKGSELSGGQWQKIALARAYMKDAPVLILDEPTAALDARAEYEAFVRFINLTKGKTSVIISHRFSTVRMADYIFVLEGGAIAEEGSHEDLMKAQKTYYELFTLQAQGYQ